MKQPGKCYICTFPESMMTDRSDSGGQTVGSPDSTVVSLIPLCTGGKRNIGSNDCGRSANHNLQSTQCKK